MTDGWNVQRRPERRGHIVRKETVCVELRLHLFRELYVVGACVEVQEQPDVLRRLNEATVCEGLACTVTLFFFISLFFVCT